MDSVKYIFCRCKVLKYHRRPGDDFRRSSQFTHLKGRAQQGSYYISTCRISQRYTLYIYCTVFHINIKSFYIYIYICVCLNLNGSSNVLRCILCPFVLLLLQYNILLWCVRAKPCALNDLITYNYVCYYIIKSFGCASKLFCQRIKK